jgi:hypothetical protein
MDEFFLVCNKMLTFIDRKLLCVIKQVHNHFMGGLDITMIGDLYQVSSIQESWIFKSKTSSLNILGTNLWHENIKCYELKQVMRQNDINFINILNRFRTTTQTFENINFINKNCFKTQPMDNTLPYLFYTNEKTTTHNNNVSCTTVGQTFKFLVQDIHSNTCPYFKSSTIPSQTNSLHHELLLKKNMLVELCAGNYKTLDGL